MGDNAQNKASERIAAIARTLRIDETMQDGVPSDLVSKLRNALSQDPDIPRPHPTLSLWQEPAHPTVSSIQSPTLPSLTDYIVIGSGVTGCSVAQSLLESPSAGANGSPPHVTVLEARTLCSGATGRNGGHFVSPAGHYYASLAKRHGDEAAADICRFSLLNVDRALSRLQEMDPEMKQESQLREVMKVSAAADEKTWNEFQESLRLFRKACPERVNHHTITVKEDMPEVRIHYLSLKCADVRLTTSRNGL